MTKPAEGVGGKGPPPQPQAHMTLLIRPVHRWYCGRCPQTDVTHDPQPHFRYHTCSGHRGLSAPFILVGTKAKVTIHEREDYVGNELVQLDPERGRPVMSITTEREDGIDTIVFAPTATASVQEMR